jgi:electron transport complex protein RnfE
MLGAAGRSLEMVIFPDYPGFLLAILPPGAFIGLGLLVAARNWLKARRQSATAPVAAATETA